MAEVERTGREALAANRRLFEQNLIALDRLRDDGERLALIRELILFAQRSGCGYYSSAEIERTLCSIAESIKADCSAPCEKDHFLIVMSEAYRIGGHTRVVERWIEEDVGHRYSLVLTRQPKTHGVPPRLMEAVKASGGEVVLFDGASDPLINARRLREFACRFEKVVLHIHTDDVVPVLAFGTERFPRPVGLYNHADHLFWIGASVADCVGELRKTGIAFTRQRRGVTDSLLVGIPPEMRQSCEVVPKENARRTLTIITCGNAEKYRPVMGIDFLAPVEEILRRVPEAEFVGIGMTFADFPQWRAVNRRVGGRIKLLGQIPYDKLLSYYDTAALYLDSRPMAGGTAITDALCRGCPVLSFPGPVGQMDWVFESSALCRSDAEIVDRAVDILRKNADADDLLMSARRTYEQHNRLELFCARVREFLSALQGPHRVRGIMPQFTGFSELDEYHCSMNSGIESVWRGWGRALNVHYELTPIAHRKIVEFCGVHFCIKRKKVLRLSSAASNPVAATLSLKERYKWSKRANGRFHPLTLGYLTLRYPWRFAWMLFSLPYAAMRVAVRKSHVRGLMKPLNGVDLHSIRPIAFYLPQYHRFPENDRWWGDGFTEWTNVDKARPLFPGHYEPHMPHPDLGHYDLSDIDVMRRQAEMAKRYGLFGFCFYYYYFKNGKRLLDKPLNNWLKSDIDFPFCYCWANENWTRTWDGSEKEILEQQDYNEENLRKMLEGMLPAFRDRRYIKVDGKPVLLVYRPEIIPRIRNIVSCWREIGRSGGFEDLYIIMVQNWSQEDPRRYGMDAATDFARCDGEDAFCHRSTFYPARFNGVWVRRYSDIVSRIVNARCPDYVRYLSVMPGWDNTPRRQERGYAIIGANPGAFKSFFRMAVRLTLQREELRRNGFVFINAWNEWGEGAHLEPDEKFGYGNLEAVYGVLNGSDSEGRNAGSASVLRKCCKRRELSAEEI